MNIVINDSSENEIINSSDDKKSKKSDNCQELKNIAYKTMLLNGTDINPKYEKHTNNQKISDFLEDESSANKKETWSKLDKTQKVMRLNEYTNILKDKYNLNDNEYENIKKYLIRCLDRKCLMKSKEVIYDKEKNIITSIPFLIFNEENRNFILRKDDKHVSTIKSLPSDKKNKNKTKTKTAKISN